MAGIETSIGGAREQFPETAWSSTLGSAARDPLRRRDTLDRLCLLYWRPVYRLIRVAHRKTVEEAKDLTQAFFCRLLEDEAFFARYRPEHGRFRHFLKGALGHFLVDAQREGARLKRGGDQPRFSLDVGSLETEQFLAAPKGGTPDQLFDQQWARDVVAQGLERLKAALLADGKGEAYRVYEALELGEADPETVSYGALARRFSISEAQVANYLHHARGRFRELLMELLADGVSTREELEQEFRDLFSTG